MSGYLHIGREGLEKLLHCRTCQARVSVVMVDYRKPAEASRRINYGQHTGGGRHIGLIVLTHCAKCSVCAARINAVTSHGWSVSKAVGITGESPIFEADLMTAQAKQDGELNPVGAETLKEEARLKEAYDRSFRPCARQRRGACPAGTERHGCPLNDSCFEPIQEGTL